VAICPEKVYEFWFHLADGLASKAAASFGASRGLENNQTAGKSVQASGF
jgi:hypothetical protein